MIDGAQPGLMGAWPAPHQPCALVAQESPELDEQSGVEVKHVSGKEEVQAFGSTEAWE